MKGPYVIYMQHFAYKKTKLFVYNLYITANSSAMRKKFFILLLCNQNYKHSRYLCTEWRANSGSAAAQWEWPGKANQVRGRPASFPSLPDFTSRLRASSPNPFAITLKPVYLLTKRIRHMHMQYIRRGIHIYIYVCIIYIL